MDSVHTLGWLTTVMPSADFRYVKGQHLSWMLYERVILSVKRTNSESKGKRLEVGWEAESLPL